MLHVFIGEILANMTQVSDVAPGHLVYSVILFEFFFSSRSLTFVGCMYKVQIACVDMQVKLEFGYGLLIFSSPELKAQVSYSDHRLSVVTVVHLS
jgi:hypothetical protein